MRHLNKKSINISRKPKHFKWQIKINELPTEIIEKIISNVDIYHRNRVRRTCIRFKHITDSLTHRLLMHMTSGEDRIFIEIINQISWAYNKAGYDSIYSSVALSILRDQQISHHRPLTSFIMKFIEKFFGLIGDQIMTRPKRNQMRLVFVITVLGFLKRLSNVSQTSDNLYEKTREIVFKIDQAWGALLWATTKNCFSFPADQSTLIVMLADIMLSSKTNRPHRKVWENEESGQIIVYGCDIPSEHKKPPYMLITLAICAENHNQAFIESASNDLDWNSAMPRTSFKGSIVINCREASRWGFQTCIEFPIE